MIASNLLYKLLNPDEYYEERRVLAKKKRVGFEGLTEKEKRIYKYSMLRSILA